MQEPITAANLRLDLAAEVRRGLLRPGQKTLPSSYLYDPIGSALFNVICLLPEYGLTRADTRLIERHAGEIAALVGQPALVAELGSGGGEKARRILEQLPGPTTTYYPIDVSEAALEQARREMALLGSVLFIGLHASYLDGLSEVAARRPPRERVLVLFLGSTIGNFDRDKAVGFLADVRARLEPGDGLLLGADLVKPEATLVAAYDDPLGVTAAFDLNLLARINRELQGEFAIERWRHRARWDARERRVEMHLESRVAQRVRVAGAGIEVDFAAGETVWTESSHKFDPDDLVRMGTKAGFETRAQWVDDEWPFAETLLVAR